jgi:ubiquinone/menaquinone biosynthesis C-methylase UbiE
MNMEVQVAAHYTQGRLEEAIREALAAAGKDLALVTTKDLAMADQFHVGGLEATQELAAHMELTPGLRLLDVGSGIGGPARYFAETYGCHVTGVDLTAEFVNVATSLTEMLNLNHLAEFKQASALHLPFAPAAFDRAYMIHVGMNIAEKAGVFREVRRVLKPGGLFVIFDNMRMADGPFRYPLPWALDETTSFVSEPRTYRNLLEHAGFAVERERDRSAYAVELTEQSMQKMAKHGPPVLGLQLLMGEKTPLMVRNILSMMKEGLVAPVELFARAV